jgi:hypothetical protein
VLDEIIPLRLKTNAAILDPYGTIILSPKLGEQYNKYFNMLPLFRLKFEHKTAVPPVDNEDTLVVTKDKHGGAKSTLNFIQSAFALQGQPSPIMKG